MTADAIARELANEYAAAKFTYAGENIVFLVALITRALKRYGKGGEKV